MERIRIWQSSRWISSILGNAHELTEQTRRSILERLRKYKANRIRSQWPRKDNRSKDTNKLHVNNWRLEIFRWWMERRCLKSFRSRNSNHPPIDRRYSEQWFLLQISSHCRGFYDHYEPRWYGFKRVGNRCVFLYCCWLVKFTLLSKYKIVRIVGFSPSSLKMRTAWNFGK